MSEITVTIVQIPGSRSAVVADSGDSVLDICEAAGIDIDGRAIRLDGNEASASSIISEDNSRITLSRGAKGNT